MQRFTGLGALAAHEASGLSDFRLAVVKVDPVLGVTLAGTCRRVLPLAALAAAVSGCAVTPKPQLSAEQKRLNLESLDHAWNIVYEQYWDPDFGGIDWPAVREQLRPRMQQATTMDEAREVLWDMISRLNRSHFAIIPAEVYKQIDLAESGGLPDGATGMDLRVVEGRALVTSVAPGSPADALGVRPGWEIVRIDDQDVPALLSELSEQLEDDLRKPLHLAYAVIPRLMGSIGQVVRVAFLDGADRETTLEFTLAERRGRKSRFGRLGNLRVWIDVKTLDENVGYIAFDGFIDPPYVMGTFNNAMRSFMNADGLIIDLRGNPGGLGAMAMGMAGWLVEGSPALGALQTRDRDLRLVIQSRPQTYAGPLAVLVDGLSGSASEFFAGGLQELGRACIIGTRTKGEALPGQFTTLPNGDVFLYATANFTSAKGNVLEGVGVIPDIEAPPTREALLAGRDPAIEAALEWIDAQNPQ